MAVHPLGEPVGLGVEEGEEVGGCEVGAEFGVGGGGEQLQGLGDYGLGEAERERWFE